MQVKTLNYAPGPLDTDMQKDFREGLIDLKLRAAFQDMHAKVGHAGEMKRGCCHSAQH